MHHTNPLGCGYRNRGYRHLYQKWHVELRRGYTYHPRRSHPRPPSRFQAAAHLGLCLPFSTALSMESPGHSPWCRSQTHLEVLPRRQSSWPRSRARLLLPLRPLPNSLQRQLAAGSRRPIRLHHLRRSSSLSGPCHSHLGPGRRARHLQRDHRRRNLWQAHLRSHSLYLVCLSRHLRHSGGAQYCLQGQ